MQLTIITNWWEAFQWADHVLWSMAVISTVLLLIVVMLDVFGIESEEDLKKNSLVKTRITLFFLAVFGWLTILFNRLSDQLLLSMVIALMASGLGTIIARWIYPSIRRTAQQSTSDVKVDVAETGQVSQSVPPHRNGFGKVQLVTDAGRKELDAITAGQALPTGAPVRVVDVIDDRVILVEPLSQKDYPHE